MIECVYMTFGKCLTILGVCSLFCWLVWLVVVFMLNPAGGPTAFLLFYFSLALALIGTFSFLGFLFRAVVLRKEEVAERGMKIAWRQSLFFAMLVIGALILQSQRWLTWWTMLILLAVMIALEFMFVAKKSR